MHYGLPWRQDAFKDFAEGQERTYHVMLGAANWDNDFATKLYHEAYDCLNARFVAKVDDIRLQAAENSKCFVAPSWSSQFDSFLGYFGGCAARGAKIVAIAGVSRLFPSCTPYKFEAFGL